MPQVMTMSRAKLLIRTLLSAALMLVVWGCTSTANEQAPKFSPVRAQHPSDWLPTHYAEFIKTPDQCKTCHGQDLKGGVSNVTCFQCHHPAGPSHLDGWEAGNQHGRLGAQAAPSSTSGFLYCQKCHGPTNFTDPIGVSPSCMQCHTKAPHPSRPWSNADWSKSTHVKTDQGNVTVCANCHKAGANSTLKPAITPPAGTQPGCFNNTLCHGQGF
jgi:hypothetical protein